eukprot:CAMPEP_0113672576 /NCGR_PEP_ID=MMETSP0038_2-20120614/6350_1 /TAXON_ID=2898 /ORGANISM="Cryptomonas paramecium" /LENGTH=177 /DNA_ID=CAMNT_0000588881 /DNA_START=6 /DNA_END=536 /DNA_ORIENTATION=+ /assembly_acc=CAM_ASM_000170
MKGKNRPIAPAQGTSSAGWGELAPDADWGQLVPSAEWNATPPTVNIQVILPKPNVLASKPPEEPKIAAQTAEQLAESAANYDKLCRKMRNLKKTLRHIDDLLEKKRSGQQLNSEQEEKVRRKGKVEKECETLLLEIDKFQPPAPPAAPANLHSTLPDPATSPEPQQADHIHADAADP